MTRLYLFYSKPLSSGFPRISVHVNFHHRRLTIILLVQQQRHFKAVYQWVLWIVPQLLPSQGYTENIDESVSLCVCVFLCMLHSEDLDTKTCTVRASCWLFGVFGGLRHHFYVTGFFYSKELGKVLCLGRHKDSSSNLKAV